MYQRNMQNIELASVQVTIMEGFFDREAKRLEFTAERTITRANEKRALDSLQTDKDQVRFQLHLQVYTVSSL